MNWPFGGLRQIAELMHEDDPRCVDYLYRCVIVAARDLGIYQRRKTYSLGEASDIIHRADRLFPRAGEDQSTLALVHEDK
jgi:hypothetical protein